MVCPQWQYIYQRKYASRSDASRSDARGDLFEFIEGFYDPRKRLIVTFPLILAP